MFVSATTRIVDTPLRTCGLDFRFNFRLSQHGQILRGQAVRHGEQLIHTIPF